MSAFTIVAVVIALAGVPADQAAVPRDLDAGVIRGLVVQHDGRWPPLETVARDMVESVTGQVHYRDCDPVIMLLAWTFQPDVWQYEPLISIGNAELGRELQLPADREAFSYAELVAHEPLLKQIVGLQHIGRGRKPDPLQSKVSDLNKKLTLLQDVFANEVIQPIPHPTDFLGFWQPINAQTAMPPVLDAWQQLGQALQDDDPAAFGQASKQLTQLLAALPAGHRPDPWRIAAELRYDRLEPFNIAWQIMAVGAVLAALALATRWRWLNVLAFVVMIAGFAVLTYGLWLRWQIAGRIPAANMFESLLFLSWGMGAFAILSMLVRPHPSVPLTASAMGALALFLAWNLPLDHYVRPIGPVLLDTIWMSIHVPLIMVSYSVLTLAVLIAHVHLVVLAAAPSNQRLAQTIDRFHYWHLHVGAILLLGGIITGSIWAASSWGRYWGWDPKEVWSLIAFVGYLAILHVRLDHDRTPRWGYGLIVASIIALLVAMGIKLAPLTPVKLMAFVATGIAMAIFVIARGPLATAVKSIAAFWLIIMTYVGVNYVLGIGLHSYGFGTGAVARYLLLTGGLDLGLVLLCCVIYGLRRRATATLAPQLSA